MATLESQLSEQIVGSLAADILAPEPPVLGLIQATTLIDGPTPKGKNRITLNWAAPTRNEAIGGELFKNVDGTPSFAQGANGAAHETQFDPIVAGTYAIYERTGASASPTTLSASAAHGQRVINAATPLPGDIVVGAFIVIEDGVNGKEEYAKVKSVNGGTGEIVLEQGLFYSHASGSQVKQVSLAARTETTHYTLDSATGVLTEVSASFAAGNKIVIAYQTALQDLSHYELYRVPGNSPISIPTKANVLAASGVQTIDAAIPSTATSKQDISLSDANNGRDFTYYIFAVDGQGNASNPTSEVVTANLHLVYVELIPSVPQALQSEVSTNKVVVTWDSVADPNANGYNIYRSSGSTFDPNTAVKLNSSLIPKGVGRISFDDSAGNSSNRVSGAAAPFPVDGQTFAYKVETEDSVTFWADGTSNIPAPADMQASKTAGAGDGTGGR